MTKKMVRSFILLVLGLVLVACSALQLSGADATASSSATSSPSIVNKLAVGVLKLEETEFSINADQAKNLLPLWKAVKSLGAEKSSSQVEIAALYEQMQESLTAEQVQFIAQTNLTATEISALAKKYAVQAPDSANTQDTTQQTTRSTSGTANSGGPGGPGGDFGGGPGGGIPGVDMMGGAAGATTSSTQTSSQAIAQQTAAARTASGISSTTNVQLAGSIIQLLEKRANA